MGRQFIGAKIGILGSMAGEGIVKLLMGEMQ
jgi:hypothetical protein